MGRSEIEIAKAIDISMEIFKRDGYERTGIDSLVEATGLNRYAIYQQFGGKRELFLAALHRDHDLTITELTDRLENRKTSAMATLKEYMLGPLEDLVGACCSSEMPGSLVCQATFELAPHDPVIAQSVKVFMDKKVSAMEKIFQIAQDDGSLREGIMPKDAALMVITTMYGLTALSQCSESKHLLEASMNSTLAILSAEKL